MTLHDVTFVDGTKSRVDERWINRWPEDIAEVDGEPFEQPDGSVRAATKHAAADLSVDEVPPEAGELVDLEAVQPIGFAADPDEPAPAELKKPTSKPRAGQKAKAS
ncbi:MAG: hypothetical protein LCH36_10360 [Actinobacteria bacterium]|nr:hypothetical protein [Actinomycetota bacterium]